MPQSQICCEEGSLRALLDEQVLLYNRTPILQNYISTSLLKLKQLMCKLFKNNLNWS